MERSFRVVIFSGGDPKHILRLVIRIFREVPEAEVCGILCERRPSKAFRERTLNFVRKLGQWDFIEYAASRVGNNLWTRGSKIGTRLLHLVHGGGPEARPALDPVQQLESLGCSLRITRDFHSQESLDFVRSLQADLGIVYGTRILKPALFSIPRLGSINIHKRKVPDYRGGGPIGLWELLDDQAEIGVTVHQVTEKLDAGAVVNAATIPIERFDNLTSLALKAHVIGNDLLVRSVADFVHGRPNLVLQQGTGRMFKSPSPQQLARYEREIAKRRPDYRPRTSRPLPKMLLKTLVGLPSITVRNWRRRLQGNFPVTILYHHIVSDSPHRMGISTDYFFKHVQFLRKHYQIVSLGQAIEMLRSNSVKRPTLVLTFDDGYRDNFVTLRAIAEHTGVPVTLFISSGQVTQEAEFAHDIANGCRGFLPLTWAQLRQMYSSGFEIGSHTRTHFDCGSHDTGRLEDEIVGSRAELEKQLGGKIEFFSFPFGLPQNISPEATAIAARTYSFILSAFGGENPAPADDKICHLKRWFHANHLWDLELQIHGVLETEKPFTLPITSPFELPKPIAT
jgi:peptidoglycan/xylan/chitin deacetylase (PgdA/CDA1 family)/folate-dependent phosphoribosylglycinamide formyltransferase PurN